MRSVALCLALGACALPPPDAEVAAAVAEVEPARLESHVGFLAEVVGPRPAGDAEATAFTLGYLETRLAALGWKLSRERFEADVPVRRVHRGPRMTTVSMTWERREQANLIAEWRGRRAPDEVVELGAHYDTVHGSPGADDNASGVAVLLEVARVLAEHPPDRTVRLVFYAMEEDGLVGSRHHAARLAERGEEPVGVVVLDMVGYASREPHSQGVPVRVPLVFDPPTTADFVLIAGNWRSGTLAGRVRDAARRYVPELKVYALERIAGWHPDGKRSDHASYWEVGIRAVLLTDTAELRTPHYHQETDLPGTLDWRFLEGVARGVCAWVLEESRVGEAGTVAPRADAGRIGARRP